MLDIYISLNMNTYIHSNRRGLNVYVRIDFGDGHDISKDFDDLTPEQYLRFAKLAAALSGEGDMHGGS